jgi:hypothetical protein
MPTFHKIAGGSGPPTVDDQQEAGRDADTGAIGEHLIAYAARTRRIKALPRKPPTQSFGSDSLHRDTPGQKRDQIAWVPINAGRRAAEEGGLQSVVQAAVDCLEAWIGEE